MNDPMKFWLRMQEMAAANMMAWLTFMEKAWQANFRQMHCMMQGAPHRREADDHKPHPCEDKSPALTSHYGHRHHDVDVEHI